MHWLDKPRISRGVGERQFTVAVEGRTVPGVFWMAAETDGPRPLVLLGHGGKLHKRAPYLLAMARWLARHHGVSALAIDGPGHGARESSSVEPWSMPSASDDIVADWQGALAAIRAEVDIGSIGYWGMSMGVMMGLPLAAATSDIRAAVFGIMGTWGPNADRLEADAPKLSCPVRMLCQWDDEIVPRDAVLKLFGLVGSADKHLRIHPGKHAAIPVSEYRDSVTFLASHLLVAPSRAAASSTARLNEPAA